jgi:hypothetical protein
MKCMYMRVHAREHVDLTTKLARILDGLKESKRASAVCTLTTFACRRSAEVQARTTPFSTGKRRWNRPRGCYLSDLGTALLITGIPRAKRHARR